MRVGAYYYLTGKIQKRDGRLQMVMTRAQEVSSERLWLLLENHQNDQVISELLGEYPGSYNVVLHYQDSKQTLQLQNISVKKSQELLEKLKPYVMKTIFR